MSAHKYKIVEFTVMGLSVPATSNKITSDGLFISKRLPMPLAGAEFGRGLDFL